MPLGRIQQAQGSRARRWAQGSPCSLCRGLVVLGLSRGPQLTEHLQIRHPRPERGWNLGDGGKPAPGCCRVRSARLIPECPSAGPKQPGLRGGGPRKVSRCWTSTGAGTDPMSLTLGSSAPPPRSLHSSTSPQPACPWHGACCPLGAVPSVLSPRSSWQGARSCCPHLPRAGVRGCFGSFPTGPEQTSA